MHAIEEKIQCVALEDERESITIVVFNEEKACGIQTLSFSL